MSDEVQLRFDYESLDTETRTFILERAEKIHKLARATAAAIVQIGQHLIEVKERLREHNKGRSHGDQERLGFLRWIEREFAWKQSVAYNFMQVAQNVKLTNFVNLEIDVSALYLIAAPKTPEPIRVEAIRRAELGEKVTHGTVKDVITEYNRTGDGPAAVAKLFDAVREARKELQQLPSPAEARRTAIETGAHTLDRTGTYQPPMTEKDQADWRADWKRVTPLWEFLRWIATEESVADLVRIIETRSWKQEFGPCDVAAAWLTEFDRKLCCARKTETSAN
jgi:hypothetical protein